jgi:hypothetical protein
MDSLEAHDSLVIRCPQLGGEAPFRYCRTVQEGLPCRRVSACWCTLFDIDPFLRDHYAEDILRDATAPAARSRLEMILELVEKVREGR